MSKGASFERVYITEKPSVAKALAEYLGVMERKDGFFVVNGGDCVTWQYGHMLEQAPPEHYLPEHLRGGWSLDSLPIIPPRDGWVKLPRAEKNKAGKPVERNGRAVPMSQIGVVCDLVRRARIIVNAGDIDREGQLVADEIIDYAGVSPEGRDKPVERVLLVALDDNSLTKALKTRRSNGEPEFVRRRAAAEGRGMADWLVGMNGTRGMSVRSGTTASVGRVQTPTLAIIVARDLEIENFKARDYFVPYVRLQDGRDLFWKGRKAGASEEGIDENGRIVDRRLAERIVASIERAMQGEVIAYKSEGKREAPPLTYNMSELQVTMSRINKMSVRATTDAAQSLYERHKAISYLGTDCRYLPESMHGEAPGVMRKLAGFLGGNALAAANMGLKRACWNDAKVSAHHAIIPTGVLPSGLNEDERRVYDAVARRYAAQFLPDYEYQSSALTVGFAEDNFAASWREPLVQGWRAINGDSVKIPAEEGALEVEEDDDDDDGGKQKSRRK